MPAVRAVKYTGRSELLARLRRLGFESLTQHPDYYGDGLALGNGEVTLYEMVQAYAALARGGVFRPLAWRSSDTFESKGHAVFGPEVSSLMAHILSDPDAHWDAFCAQPPDPDRGQDRDLERLP